MMKLIICPLKSSETLIEEMGRESNDLEDPNPQRERGDEEGIVPQIIQFEYENGTNDTGSATESTYEDRIVCNQCSTVLPLGEEASNDGKCIHCERQENIVNERKRSRECLEKQATKMLKLSNRKFSDVQAGTTVRVPIPDVDRARGSPRNVLAVVNSVEDGLYKLGTPHGALKHKFTSDSAKNKEISLREVAAENSVLGGQGYKRCHCKGGCKNNKCACRANKKICNSKCHGSLSCHNKND
ncbi:uncharacterized protein LOC116174503 [Photinus pyralis]|uniref:uncharacterized protein LOC116161277 n=1 Tax=Photinus pyralis TaxID=7054 RepID=UPI001266ED99|nr:uncharacterized protein LOC116161277 [Photinus pyralis]XP_031348296.1 uncharacterized protein LOC116174503 [Photinus pyralis]